MSAVRPATPDDLPRLARLHAECFDDGWDTDSLANLLSAAGSISLATDSGFIIVRVAADEAEILTICVSPSARRHGTGLALLKAAAAKASQVGAAAMFLEVATGNVAAQSLYTSCGFRPVGRRPAYYKGQDALVLRAELPLAFRMGNPEETL